MCIRDSAGDDSYPGDGPGTLVMNAGSSVVDFPFGGVTVGKEGTFVMNGGIISGNGFSNKTAGGNGVYVKGCLLYTSSQASAASVRCVNALRRRLWTRPITQAQA